MNDFVTVKEQAASEKFNLIRIEPARAVQDDLTLQSGTTYTITFPFSPVSKVTVNGTTYDKVTGTPASGEFSFNEDTKVLLINLGVALTTQFVVVFYYLFYTKDKFRITYETPTDDTTTTRRWVPRIAADPTFDYNLRDVSEGFVSFGFSSIELNNEDGEFEQYFGPNDSFANKRVTIWLALEDVENVQILFRGLIKSATISRRVFLEFYDELSVLSQTLYSNGTYLDSSYNLTRFPNMHPQKQNFPIYKLYAEVSSYRVGDQPIATGLFRITSDRLLEAVCINYSTTLSTSNNREWGLNLNEGDGGHQTDTAGTIDNTDPNFTLVTYTAGKKYRIGDTILVRGTVPNSVLFVDTAMNQMRVGKDAGMTLGDSIVRPGPSAIVITRDGVNYYARYDGSYSVTYLGNTNDIIKITFTSTMEANVGLPTPLNPDTDQVWFRSWADNGKDLKHGSVIKEILESAGLTVNAASITSANTDSTVKTNFYVPTRLNPSFKTYAAVIGDLLRSTFGYISVNNDLEFVYALFDSPTASTEINDRVILLNSFDQFLDYNDIINVMIPENEHDILELDFVNNSLTSAKATYLHEVSTQRTYFHVLADTSRMSPLFNYLSTRKGFYSFSTKTNPDAIIGDDFSITRAPLIGNASSANVTVIKISKKTTQTDFMGIDLIDVT